MSNEGISIITILRTGMEIASYIKELRAAMNKKKQKEPIRRAQLGLENEYRMVFPDEDTCVDETLVVKPFYSGLIPFELLRLVHLAYQDERKSTLTIISHNNIHQRQCSFFKDKLRKLFQKTFNFFSNSDLNVRKNLRKSVNKLKKHFANATGKNSNFVNKSIDKINKLYKIRKCLHKETLELYRAIGYNYFND